MGWLEVRETTNRSAAVGATEERRGAPQDYWGRGEDMADTSRTLAEQLSSFGSIVLDVKDKVCVCERGRDKRRGASLPVPTQQQAKRLPLFTKVLLNHRRYLVHFFDPYIPSRWPSSERFARAISCYRCPHRSLLACCCGASLAHGVLAVESFSGLLVFSCRKDSP